MIRRISTALLIFAAVILQCCVFQVFEIASIKPNLLIILTVSFALMRGSRSGLLIGFFGGLLMDILFPGTMGFQALVYMWIGYLFGNAYRIFYDDDIKTPLLFITLADLLYGIIYYFFQFALRGRIHFFWYLGRIIIPEALYTIIITLLTYRLLYSINRKLDKADKRSIDSLV